MKVAQWLGYGLAFAFIGLCALLTAWAGRGAEKPDADAAPPMASGTPSPGAFPFGWTFEESFRTRDTDGDGRLSLDESLAGWSSADPERAERSRRIFEASDTDGDGFVTLEESRDWWAKARAAMERAREWFEQRDVDADGRLSLEEALAGLEDEPERDQAAQRFDRMDRDADGYIDGRELRTGIWSTGAQ